MARADLIESMARFLRDLNVDLDDERAVFRTLSTLHFLHGDIIAYSDEAVKLARGGSQSVRSIFGDSAIAVFAVAVWLIWYCVLCPPAEAATSAVVRVGVNPIAVFVIAALSAFFAATLGLLIGGVMCTARISDLHDEIDRLRGGVDAQ